MVLTSSLILSTHPFHLYCTNLMGKNTYLVLFVFLQFLVSLDLSLWLSVIYVFLFHHHISLFIVFSFVCNQSLHVMAINLCLLHVVLIFSPRLHFFKLCYEFLYGKYKFLCHQLLSLSSSMASTLPV